MGGIQVTEIKWAKDSEEKADKTEGDEVES